MSKDGVTYVLPNLSDSVAATVKRKMNLKKAIDRTFPMSVIFLPTGSLYEETDNEWLCINRTSKGLKFQDLFKKYPTTFIRLEKRLEERCKEHGIAYIPPKMTDSEQTTLERKKTLNKAIATANKR